MGQENEGTGDGKQLNKLPFLEDVLKATEQLLRTALQKGTPKGIEREAVKLYHDTEDSKGKTAAMLGACLSSWESLVGQLNVSSEEDRPLSLTEVSERLIHRAYLHKRRRGYRDKQMGQQIARANVRGEDGELLPFNPPAPQEGEIFLEDLEEVIALVLKDRSVRDRMILEMRLDELTYEAIVEKIKAALPRESISQATVSRVVERFRDELRGHLEDE
ncbi:MAG TPA: hypothetical protein VMG10_27965 [Gemmataceae bacterium]|nr:hypothetical protein [Gemmataceae bacterium]